MHCASLLVCMFSILVLAFAQEEPEGIDEEGGDAEGECADEENSPFTEYYNS
ncbi:unnamed protein product [Heligmosomoides polygyrus]|uniref:Secreted protein n=1 Tax=Heligmosomoides polygyrus TaxID=6339 RepID=A0A183FTK5_HELPZ|nr:unnamed protein product [Heligmosomoides polygyrus]